MIETRSVPSLIRLRWRTRLRLWWARRREPPEIREIRERLDRELEQELLFGKKEVL